MAGADVGMEGSRSGAAPAALGPAVDERRRRGRLGARLRHDPVAAASAVFLVLVTLAAVLAPARAPQDPSAIIDRPMAPPGGEAMLGTDDVGRDLVSRLLYASRVSLAVGVGAAVLTVLIGTFIGSLAGFYGGRIDLALSGLKKQGR